MKVYFPFPPVLFLYLLCFAFCPACPFPRRVKLEMTEKGERGREGGERERKGGERRKEGKEREGGERSGEGKGREGKEER